MKSVTKIDSAVRWFDFTCKAEEHINKKNLIDFLTPLCKKWVFQLEKGSETGYLHYQGRVCLLERKRFKTMICLSSEEGLKCHWSMTSKPNIGNFDYVSKNETRVDGPWTHLQPDGPVRHMQKMADCKLYGWQSRIVEILKCHDERLIHCIWDPIGGNGKSWFKDYLRWADIARVLPPMRDIKDIMAAAMGGDGIKSTFVFDLPRCVKHDEFGDLYTGIESLKDGIAYDTRYKFKELNFSRPNILILTNTLPDVTVLSRDRWSIHFICPTTNELS